MSDLPDPLTPPDCDLSGYQFMPIEVIRLRDSDLVAEETPEACWAAFLIWMGSWHQVPAASVPDSDSWLAKQAGYVSRGQVDPRWFKIKRGAMRGWIKCNDGRLYHPVVAEKAIEAWKKKKGSGKRGMAGANAKWRSQQSDSSKTRSERLSKARSKGTHTKEEWQAMLFVFDETCVRCGDKEKKIVKDHIEPIYQGGSDGIDNLQPLCFSCNSSKGAESKDYRFERLQDWKERLQERLQNACCENGERLQNACCENGERLQMPSNREGEGDGEGNNPHTPADAGDTHASKNSEPLGFVEFWNLYPPGGRKRSRSKCLAKWETKKLEGKSAEIIAGLKRWKLSEEWANSEGKYIPATLVFLNDERWEAHPAPKNPNPSDLDDWPDELSEDEVQRRLDSLPPDEDSRGAA